MLGWNEEIRRQCHVKEGELVSEERETDNWWIEKRNGNSCRHSPHVQRGEKVKNNYRMKKKQGCTAKSICLISNATNYEPGEKRKETTINNCRHCFPHIGTVSCLQPRAIAVARFGIEWVPNEWQQLLWQTEVSRTDVMHVKQDRRYRDWSE